MRTLQRFAIGCGLLLIASLACRLAPGEGGGTATEPPPPTAPPAAGSEISKPTETLSSATETPAPTQGRVFETEAFSFIIPPGWATGEEVWGESAATGRDYYGLGVQEVVMIQYPAEPGRGQAFFAVASAPLGTGEDLEARFTEAYRSAVPEIVDASTRPFEQGALTGYEITYRRPWGEPWWQFRDIWLEREGTVYVLSFHASPHTFANYAETFERIIASFRFKDG